MIIDDLDASSPGEQPDPTRPLTAAETFARALGTAPAPDPPEPRADSVDVMTDDDTE